MTDLSIIKALRKWKNGYIIRLSPEDIRRAALEPNDYVLVVRLSQARLLEYQRASELYNSASDRARKWD